MTRSDQYAGAMLTVLPMAIHRTDAAQETDVVLQVMLAKGESVKGKPKEGMTGSYSGRKVKLEVAD